MEATDNQNNLLARRSDAQSAVDATARRARVIEGTDVIECLTDDPICHWGFTFGDRMFCSHPSNKLIAEGARFSDCPTTFSLP